MKKLLKVSATSVWLFIILSFSHKIMSLAKWEPLFVRKGVIVGSSVIIFETFYHAIINTQDEYIQLSRLIDLLTWAPSCLVYSNCHNSALNYNIHLSNYSKVKKNVLIEIIMIYTF
jgi:hypothetical protein